MSSVSKKVMHSFQLTGLNLSCYLLASCLWEIKCYHVFGLSHKNCHKSKGDNELSVSLSSPQEHIKNID